MRGAPPAGDRSPARDPNIDAKDKSTQNYTHDYSAPRAHRSVNDTRSPARPTTSPTRASAAPRFTQRGPIVSGAAPISCVHSVYASPVRKSTSESGAPDNSSLSHFSAMTLPCWLR